jgi:hypothetical protein
VQPYVRTIQTKFSPNPAIVDHHREAAAEAYKQFFFQQMGMSSPFDALGDVVNIVKPLRREG